MPAPSRVNARCSRNAYSGYSIERGINIPSSIKYAEYRYRIGAHLQCDNRSPFKTKSAQPGSQIVSPGAPLRKHRKTAATVLDSVHVANRSLRAIPHCNIVIQINQVAESLGTEFNPSTHAASLPDLCAGRESWQTPDPPESRDRAPPAWHRKRQRLLHAARSPPQRHAPATRVTLHALPRCRKRTFPMQPANRCTPPARQAG